LLRRANNSAISYRLAFLNPGIHPGEVPKICVRRSTMSLGEEYSNCAAWHGPYFMDSLISDIKKVPHSHGALFSITTKIMAAIYLYLIIAT